MHKGTVSVYQAQAEYWTKNRRDSGRVDELAIAVAFRDRVGEGVILDLGCGPGRFIPGFGPPAVGVDASMAMLHIAAADGRGPLALGDIEVLPFRTGSVAGAFGNCSFQHLPRDGFARALAELHRVLRSGGLVFLCVHAGEFEGDARPGDDIPGRWFTYWKADSMTAALCAAGFEVLSCEEAGSVRAWARRP